MDARMRQHVTNVRESLKAWRRHAWAARMGGLAAEYNNVQQAMLSIDVIEAWMDNPQYSLLDQQEDPNAQ